MRIASARAAGKQWVQEHACLKPWFKGAYFTGSTVGKSSEAELSNHSDVDIVIVTTHEEPPLKLGKFEYKGVLLEITYFSWNQLCSIESVQHSYHLANSFRTDTIISDPSGELGVLQKKVSGSFKQKTWTTARCQDAVNKIRAGMNTVDSAAPFHDRVTGWLFPTGITTHVVLAAAHQNPTVRLRYPAARDVLFQYKEAGLYNELLTLLGSHALPPHRAEHHVKQLAKTFDAAAKSARTPFFFSSDITVQARPIAIDGSLKMIDLGLHREAMFWIVATFARCHKILEADASSQMQRSFFPAFEDAVTDLGITSSNDIHNRKQKVLDFLPDLWKTAELIIQRNPEVTGE
ncbi:hypothetical protein E2R51_07280 [Jeotgalibacillus sp. S-D1]|uniref:hypothetical protein n=1 Tax=Jeotgalibacillus sp. S-D1 TaxID=2552189 RepID=UPI001059B7DC|nr:hypothetical protein [Jeotgalibacillus sp. S-D1]TDL32484.1 hypothetical protein E2R51_07280 [Jeotgalibacillus sp. S-D1]